MNVVRPICLWTLALILGAQTAEAQLAPWLARKHFTCRRLLETAPGAKPDLAVVEFLTHGAMDRQRDKVVVTTTANRPVASRVMQLGPNDLCKVVFETQPRVRHYYVYYGVKSLPSEAAEAPAFTVRKGLALEVRRWRRVNMHDFASVKKATNSAATIGSRFVPTVFMGGNPFVSEAEPCLIVFRGWLNAPASGQYTFATTSVDASFIAIDGRAVCEWSGRHWVTGRSKHTGAVRLTAGSHEFEYYNARQGHKTFCVAAWAPPGKDQKAPLPIPASAFGTVTHAQVKSVEQRGRGAIPDFGYQIAGEALYHPAPEMAERRRKKVESRDRPPEPKAVVRVRFVNQTSAKARHGSQFQWDFGDGQTSEEVSPEHVYLTTGAFKVTLSLMPGRQKPVTNTILVRRDWPVAFSQAQAAKRDEQAPPPLRAMVAPVKRDYDLTRLDGRSLVAAMEIWRLLKDYKQLAAVGAALMKREDLDGFALKRASEIAADAMCRHAGEARQAVGLLERSAQRCSAPVLKAELLALAAGARLTYLDQPAEALAALGRALPLAERANVRPALRRVHIRLGDCYRRVGEPAKARQEYALAAGIRVADEAEDFEEKAIGPSLLSRYVDEYLRRRTVKVDWRQRAAEELRKQAAEEREKKAEQRQKSQEESKRGKAAGDRRKKPGKAAPPKRRKTAADRRKEAEAVRKKAQLEERRARAERADALEHAWLHLRLWEWLFPRTKVDGYYSLMAAQYFRASKQARVAVREVTDLLNVTPEAAEAGKLLWLRAECHRDLNDLKAAEADYQTLVRDYPGDPLVPRAQRALAELRGQAGRKEAWKRASGDKGGR